jgi:hypothetical protein
MTPDQFTYWLQGFAELNPEPPSAEQWQAIRDHLALVFEKRTPERFLSLQGDTFMGGGTIIVSSDGHSRTYC